MNTYDYSLQNPLSIIDPSGLSGDSVIGSVWDVIKEKVLGNGNVIASTGKKALEAEKAFLNVHKDIAEEDYAHFESPVFRGQHLYPYFDGINWDLYGSTFEEAYNNYLQSLNNSCQK